MSLYSWTKETSLSHEVMVFNLFWSFCFIITLLLAVYVYSHLLFVMLVSLYGYRRKYKGNVAEWIHQ